MGKLNFRRLNKIISMLFEMVQNVSDDDSDVSKNWHYMHISTCSQLIKIEAKKRGLSQELAAITAALHDYGLLVTGKKENHAKTGAELVGNFLGKYNRLHGTKRGVITVKERNIITYAILHHSEKSKDSGEPYTELLKDMDCLDRYLHGVETGGAYMKRIKKLSL